MEILIKGEAKEIAALVSHLQERQDIFDEDFVENFSEKIEQSLTETVNKMNTI